VRPIAAHLSLQPLTGRWADPVCWRRPAESHPAALQGNFRENRNYKTKKTTYRTH
jgi:hypothetical protein